MFISANNENGPALAALGSALAVPGSPINLLIYGVAFNSASIIVHFGGMIAAITRCEAFHLAAFLPPLPTELGPALAANSASKMTK